MSFRKFLYKALRKMHKGLFPKKIGWMTDDYVQFFNQDANDLVRFEIEKSLKNNTGLMVSKFGTIELNAVCCQSICESKQQHKYFHQYLKYIYEIFPDDAMKELCNNAGFFPNNPILLKKYSDLVKKDMLEIDILGSYSLKEDFFKTELSKCKKVNLNGYYAPFLWSNPWTLCLENKRVLVIHPFVESIRYQYENNREMLFKDKNVLPKFSKLITIKAVQSIADNKDNIPYSNWFDALTFMQNEIDKVDFDVAIIGCGAYGMHLAAYIKRKGKIAIHMAGWTQMLFGVYGERWIKDQTEFSRFINEYWTRPGENEKPKGLEKVENGCYW